MPNGGQIHLNNHYFVRTGVKEKNPEVSSKIFRSLKPSGVNGSSGA